MFERSIPELLKYGFIVLDKPCGPTSAQTLNFLKEFSGVRKAGHAGTLDPKVTGVLLVALNNSTRALNFIESEKEYVCLMRLHADITEALVRIALTDFVGIINQKVPRRSAVKRQVRRRRVINIEFLDMQGRGVLFKVSCQAGTYVRMLVHDVGVRLGCGANMAELRRIRVGGFSELQSFTLNYVRMAFDELGRGNEFFIRECVRPVEELVSYLKWVVVFDTAVSSLCYGALLYSPGVADYDKSIVKDDIVRVLTSKGELIGVGHVLLDGNNFVKMERVIMDTDLYPKMWKRKQA